MPPSSYVTVTLKKDILKKLIELNPTKSTSKAVTDAIYDYIDNRKHCKPVFKTPDVPYLLLSDSNQVTVRREGSA